MGLRLRWGTWEELLLGGAVLRHGTDAWDTVAGELRARTDSSSASLFTPKECQAKYKDIQEQYSGCNAWFEELRKRRVAELKRELERSEDSIGSLQSKLESLTSETRTASNLGHNSSQSESASPVESANVDDSSTKNISRDGSSAGSITEKTDKDCTRKCSPIPVQENNLHVQQLEDSNKRFGCGCLGISFGNFKKKRGKRKRKGCNLAKEGSVGDNDTLSSAPSISREEATDLDSKPSSDDHAGTFIREVDDHLYLTGIMDSIMEHKDVSIFRGRLESQKRARYRKLVRRHIDFRNIISRIASGSISSVKELFRELLLLCNNALVFYPKNSAEHKSALVLRDLVNKKLREGYSSRNLISSYSDDDDDDGGAVQKSSAKPKRLRTAPQDSSTKNKLTAGKRDETQSRENAALVCKAAGSVLKENAEADSKGAKAAEDALVAGKEGGTLSQKEKTVALASKGKGDRGAPRKEKGAVGCSKVARSPVKRNGSVGGKRGGASLKGRSNKGPSRADNMSEESPVIKKTRGVGRPAQGSQRGGRRSQETTNNRGRKRARR